MRKTKWLSEEALQIAVKRREMKSKGEKEIKRTKAQQNLTIIHICTQAQRIKNILSTLFKKIKADQFETNSEFPT